MSEDLQILLLGILFQRLHHSNTKYWTKKQVLQFLLDRQDGQNCLAPVIFAFKN